MELIEKQIKAIKLINPNAKFVIRDNNLDTIEWEDTTPIAKADIEAKMLEVENEYNNEDYKRKRQAEYPMLDEVIHALIDGGDTLTKLQEKRQAVKTKYPKPE